MIDKLYCIYTNVDSLLNKRSELLHITALHAPDVLALTEILPKNTRFEVDPVEIQIEGYKCYTNIQSTTAHRGVAIYVKEHLSSSLLNTTGCFKESIWCEIDLEGDDRLLVGCIYRSPNSSDDNNTDINKALKQFSDGRSHVLIMGDFNHPEINWTDETSPTDPNHRAYKFMEAVRDSFLYQHVTEPTHTRGTQTANTLDLIFTTEQEMVGELRHEAPLGKSHHQLLIFNYICYASIPQNQEKTKYLIYKGDYARMNKIISEIDWPNKLLHMNIDQMWATIEDEITQATNDCIPKKKGGNNQTKRPSKWMNQATWEKIKEKKRAYRTFRQSGSEEDYNKYARARNQAKTACKKAVKDFTKNISREVKNNPKAFYSYARSRMKTREGIADLVTEDGTKLTGNKEKADILNEYFSSVFTIDNDQTQPHFQEKCRDPLESLAINEEQVRKKLTALKPNKSPGPDSLHPYVLKELASSLAAPLTILFNKSIQVTQIPDSWKKAHVTPIFKKGSRHSPSNYRPVSLTSVICKLLESLVRDAMVEHMTTHGLFSNFQHGFIRGRSCATNLLTVLDAWTEAIDQGLPVDVAYLDLAKAFDKVSHPKLLQKLWAYGIRGSLHGWTKSFLEGRQQRVIINSVPSAWNPVTSGVPQGSVLGPILFVIFVNDLPEHTISIAQMFADDTKLYRVIHNQHDRDILQQDLSNLKDWAENWKLQFNASKCKILHIGINNPHHEYHMGETGAPPLEITTLEKDLGVLMDPELKFTEHVEKQVNKANKILGLIRRTFEYLDGEIMKRLFTSLVRPHLEFSNVAWSPRLIKDQRLIESVQRRATKLVPELKQLSYEERLRKLKLPSLYYRRTRGDMIETYKLMHGHYTLNQDLVELHGQFTTRGHPLKAKKKYCRTNLRKSYFSYRIVDNWNSLPAQVVQAKSINAFKSKLDRHWAHLHFTTDPILTTTSTPTQSAISSNQATEVDTDTQDNNTRSTNRQ